MMVSMPLIGENDGKPLNGMGYPILRQTYVHVSWYCRIWCSLTLWPLRLKQMLSGGTTTLCSGWDWEVWISEIQTKQQIGKSWGLAGNRKVSYICQLGIWDIFGSMEARRSWSKANHFIQRREAGLWLSKRCGCGWLTASNQCIGCFATEREQNFKSKWWRGYQPVTAQNEVWMIWNKQPSLR